MLNFHLNFHLYNYGLKLLANQKEYSNVYFNFFCLKYSIINDFLGQLYIKKFFK